MDSGMELPRHQLQNGIMFEWFEEIFKQYFDLKFYEKLEKNRILFVGTLKN